MHCFCCGTPKNQFLKIACSTGQFCCNSTCGDSCDCVPDCNGVVGGGTLVDDCGVCGGLNNDQDVCGVCFGFNATLDRCGVCFGDGLSCCGDGILQPGEDCDPLLSPNATCCDFATCQFSNPSVVCKASAGLCDVPELCTGFSTACPEDLVLANGTACRDASGECAKPGLCDGLNAFCPPEELYPPTHLCKAGGDNLCSFDSFCTWTNSTCPPVVQLPDGTSCDLDADVCTADTCLNFTCIASGSPCFANCSHGEICTPQGGNPACTNLSATNFPGCDGIPASGLVPDRCGVCGGDGSTCQSIVCDTVADCPALMDCCGTPGVCVNVETDEKNCGLCANGRFLLSLQIQ